MSEVPWAPGRRALILTSWGWREGFGRAPRGNEHACWVVPNDDGEARVWVKTAQTAFLPLQCPHCFEVVNHQSGCMVAANLARGVPAFWAPFAMWTHPAPGCEYVQLPLVVGDGVVSETVVIMKWMTTGHNVFFVALGPNGPTLAPWGL